MNTTQNFHQGRLSGPIFTDQSMDFTALNSKINFAQHEIPLKRLADMLGAQQRPIVQVKGGG
jgi:hypothetical protein